MARRMSNVRQTTFNLEAVKVTTEDLSAVRLKSAIALMESLAQYTPLDEVKSEYFLAHDFYRQYMAKEGILS